MTDFSKAYENLQRQAFRKTCHRLWNLARADRLDELSEAEYKLALILMDHPEYATFFEDADILDGREFDAASAGNPFLHISFHKMIEDQLAADSPQETSCFYEAMEDRGYERHPIIHTIMKILVRLVWDAMTHQKSFDANRYRLLLSRYRQIAPEDIPEALEREFLSH